MLEPSSRFEPTQTALRVNLLWLTRLRWMAMFGQLLVILIADQWMGVPLPLLGLAAVLLGLFALGMLCVLWLRRGWLLSHALLAGLMAADVAFFTTALYLTGGPSNPFSSLYLIHIALAAVVLPAAWSWALVALVLGCSAVLFVDHVPLAMDHDHSGHGDMEFGWHLRGMWIALGVAASFIVYFLHRIMSALHERERELDLVRERSQRQERLTSLITLAAGAAHELASPLMSIELASGELTRELTKEPAVLARCRDDLTLIRNQLLRCRRILERLALDAGQPSGEAPCFVGTRELIEQTLQDLDQRERVQVSLSLGEEGALAGPRGALVQALRSLVENALEASSADQQVRLLVTREQSAVCFEVRDSGAGMSPGVLARACDPFYSTKEASGGLGLGLFLAQSVAEQVGGRLELDSAPGRGTRARLILTGLGLQAASGSVPRGLEVTAETEHVYSN